jgi:pimeloyl-ACP methyl ester carboxylesterase
MNPPGRKRLRAARTVAAAITAAGLASAAYQEAAAARDRRRFPPLGRLVDIGGRKLHLLEAGHGTPTIVVIPALGDGVLQWVPVQRELASDLHVCVYDRSGIGWSDPPRRGPRTIDGLAAELHALLAAAGIEPPYVLAGHSAGGVIARRFAVRYPGKVAGMVVIDSSHEQQADRRGVHGWPNGRSDYVKHALQWQARLLGPRRLGAGLHLVREVEEDIVHVGPPDPHLAAAFRALLLSTRYRRVVVREMLMMMQLTEAPPSLGALPLTVITAGGPVAPGWREMQAELAALSADSTHITAAGAGHYVHLDSPEVVVQAIRDMARKAG